MEELECNDFYLFNVSPDTDYRGSISTLDIAGVYIKHIWIFDARIINFVTIRPHHHHWDI